MIDRIQHLPEERQKIIRLMAVSMEGPRDRPDSMPLPLVIGIVIMSVFALIAG